MKDSPKVLFFPKDMFRKEIQIHSGHVSPAFSHNEYFSSIEPKPLYPTPRIHKKISAKELVFAAKSARALGAEKHELKYDFSQIPNKKYASHKILPPLKPALHVSTHKPIKNSIEKNSNLLTFTFNANQLKNNAYF